MAAGIFGMGMTAFFACADGSKNLGVVEAKYRTLPLTPGNRAALASRGARCSPAAGGPVLCTWSSEEAACTLIFDTQDVLTRLDCSVDSMSYTCTLRHSLYVCAWSDEPNCAQVFFADGSYADYACGDALEAFIAAGGGGVPGACPDGTDDCLIQDAGPVEVSDAGVDAEGDGGVVDAGPVEVSDAGVDAEGNGGVVDAGPVELSDGGVTVSGEGLAIFVRTVAPIVQAQCANGACHGSPTATPRLSSGEPVNLYLEVLSSGLAGSFDSNAPIVTRPGPIGEHFTTYTTAELEAILAWLEEERVTRGL